MKKPYGPFKMHFIFQFRKVYREVTLSMLEYNPEAKLLDLGCSNGGFVMEVAEKIGTKKVFGIDIDESEAKKGLTKYQGDLNEPFPVPGEEFDVVSASQIIEHLGDTDSFVKEIYRVLKPSGYLVISTENLASLHNVAYLILGKQPGPCSVSDVIGRGVETPGHRRLFTVSGLSKLLRYYGFKIEKTKGCGYPPLPLCLARFMNLVDKRHSKGIVMKARK